jgi:hypothetical protein
MKSVLASLASLAVCLLVGCSSTGDTQTSINLFNGKNLDGWKAFLVDDSVALEDVWSVRDGILVCQGEPMGYLYIGDYEDFKLDVEWRWAPGTEPGNSGVLMRMNGGHKPKGLPRCLEAQLKSGSAGDLYGFHGMKITGPADRLVEVPGHELGGDLTGVKKMAAAENQPGQWNRYEIIVDGPLIKVWVNGQLVNEAGECEVTSGPIGLQSEGGEIHFRTVRLTPVRPPTAEDARSTERQIRRSEGPRWPNF